MSSKYIPSIVLSGAADLIRKHGGDPIMLAQQAGLPPDSLHDGDLPVDIAAVLGLFDASAEQCECRNFGMHLAARNGLDIFGPLWVLLRNAKTVRQLLVDLCANYDIYTRAATLSLEPSGDGQCLCWDTVTRSGINTTQGAEYGFALTVYELRKFRSDFTPLAMQFRHAAPADIGMHRELFGACLSFNQDRNAMHFSVQDLDMSLGQVDSRTHALMRSVLRWDTATQQTGVAERIENMVRTLLPYSACTVEEVARAMGMRQRTLQDRLQKSQTSFKKIKDAVRYDLALKYLNSSSLSLVEISEILGYSELSAFSRSFKRWHGQPASTIRRQSMEPA